jgi:uncharacterized DUF497 family protein
MSSRNIGFKWNHDKAKLNLRLHRVSFEEAETVFDDPHGVIISDEDHSEDETREVLIGYSSKNRLLFVSFTVRAEMVRIISARLATLREIEEYEEGI